MEKGRYITKSGLKKLQNELKELEKERMRRVREGYEFEDMAVLESRMNEISGVLQSCEVVSLPPKHERDTVALGATVAVETKGKVKELTIVSTYEADPMTGRVSDASPVGQALLGKKVGDVALVSASSGIKYRVTKVSYGKDA